MECGEVTQLCALEILEKHVFGIATPICGHKNDNFTPKSYEWGE